MIPVKPTDVVLVVQGHLSLARFKTWCDEEAYKVVDFKKQTAYVYKTQEAAEKAMREIAAESL